MAGKEAAPIRALPFADRIRHFQLGDQTTSVSEASGRRSPALSTRGAALRPSTTGYGIHIVGTITAAIDRLVSSGELASAQSPILEFHPSDVRGALRRGKESNLIVFLVDCSGSMAAKDRLKAVTGAIASMFDDAYQRRDKVAVVTLRGSKAQLVVPPTRSVEIAKKRLDRVTTGGRTPLADGLVQAQMVIERERRKEPGRRPLLVVLSDGRATGKGGVTASRQAAMKLHQDGVGSVVIDCEKQGRIQLGLARDLAGYLGDPCIRLGELTAGSVGDTVKVFSSGGSRQ